MPRTNFTNDQKAHIYARDLATCSYSGQNLWLLDKGASGFYMPDWADHIKPASRGGASDVENGACASWIYNWRKGNATHGTIMLFSYGSPTHDFFFVHDFVPLDVRVRWERFSTLHPSDWYFNRAVWRVGLGLHDLDPEGSVFTAEKMDEASSEDEADASNRVKPNYISQAKAAFKRIESWRKQVEAEGVKSLEDRGIVGDLLWEDQELFLKLRDVSSHEEVVELMKRLLPFHKANAAANNQFRRLHERIHYATTAAELEAIRQTIAEFIRSLQKNTSITPIVRDTLIDNVQAIYDF